MTKEELKQEAEEFVCSKQSFWKQGKTCVESVRQAYIMGAEPREKQIAELEKENAELKGFINAPHTKGRSTTRGDYIKTVWDLSKKLAEAKEIIKKLSSTYKYVIQFEKYADRKILTEAEQFISEVEK